MSSRLANAAIGRQELDAPLAGLQQVVEPPPWVETLRAIFVSSSDGVASDCAGDRGTPLPFEDLLLGAVRHARVEASARSSNLEVLSAAAAAMLERQLLAHLTFVASGPLGQEFYEFRFRHAPLAAFETQFCEQPETTQIYNAFVEMMRGGGVLRLLDRYPVLARLLSQAVDQWVLTTTQLCDRYAVDFADLENLLDADLQPVHGSIIRAEADLSDRHDEGATVVALMLESGHRFVYKPRSAGGERAWATVLAWLNGKEPGCTLTAARVLDRGSHHWGTWVPVEACATEDEVDRFYVRCGVTLAALHVLAATDIHFDNLIASADEPVVVDLEMLLNPGAGADFGSLDRTGMLPNWQTAPGGRRFDMSALGADSDQDPGVALPAWEHVNTDQMKRVTAHANGPRMDHRVRLGDTYPTALAGIHALLRGFASGYRCFLEGREELKADRDIRAALSGIDLRVLMRDTSTYARLLLHLLQPDLLRDGLDRSIEIEWLARPLSVAVSSPVARLSIYDFERRAMEAQDVPRFTTTTWSAITEASEDQDLLALGNGRTSETFYTRLRALSEADLLEQLAVIEESVHERFARPTNRQ